LITYLMRLAFSCWIPAQAQIGAGTRLGYGGLGIVIHHNAVIGRDCLISQGVTLGGGRRDPGSTGTGVPRLGDSVQVGAGAKIIGGVEVGDGAVIGANSVVTRDVEPGVVVAGIPARALRKTEPGEVDLDP
jgi:serine O-acetyltransferase